MERFPGTPEQKEHVEYPEIAATIEQLAAEDQRMRAAAQSGEAAWDAALDVRNTDALKGIVEKIGWPTRSKVGRWPSHSAWLLVQHAVHDQDFMQRCLALMQEAPPGEVDPANIAYLDDRLRILRGEPQRYGTQYKMQDGAYVLLETEDPEQVNERRAAMGIPYTVEEYLRRANGASPEVDQ